MIDWIGDPDDSLLRGCPVKQPSRREAVYEIWRVRVKGGVQKWRVDRIRQAVAGSWPGFDDVVVGWFSKEAGAREAAEIDLENLAPRPNHG